MPVYTCYNFVKGQVMTKTISDIYIIECIATIVEEAKKGGLKDENVQEFVRSAFAAYGLAQSKEIQHRKGK